MPGSRVGDVLPRETVGGALLLAPAVLAPAVLAPAVEAGIGPVPGLH